MPDQTTAPPPAAPPAPAAPAESTPAPSMPVPGSPRPLALESAFQEIDALAGKPAKQEGEEPAEPAAPPEKEKQAPPPTSDTDDLDAVAKPRTQQQQQPKAATLRVAYEKTKSELETARKEIQAREAKLAEIQKQYEELRKKPPEVNGDFELVKKRNTELEEAIKFADFKRSKEYSEKYDAPLQEAYQAALQEITGMPIENEDRRASDKDLFDLLQLNAGDAAKKAGELFGAAGAAIALGHRSAILRLNSMRAKAEKEFGEVAKKQVTDMAARRQRLVETYEAGSAEMENRLPHLFKFDAEKEKDLAEAFQKGLKLSDTAFLGFADGGNDPELPFKLAKVQANVRMRAAALMPALIKLKAAEEEIAGLKKRLGSYENSEPGGPSIRAESGAPGKSWEQEIEELVGKKP